MYICACTNSINKCAFGCECVNQLIFPWNISIVFGTVCGIVVLRMIWSCLHCFLHLNFKLKMKSDQEKLTHDAFISSLSRLMHFIVDVVLVRQRRLLLQPSASITRPRMKFINPYIKYSHSTAVEKIRISCL